MAERTGGYGAEVAAPIARRILAEYFAKEIARQNVTPSAAK